MNVTLDSASSITTPEHPGLRNRGGRLAGGRFVGGRARFAYTAATQQFYAQPALNLDVVSVHSGSAQEVGTGPLGITLAAATQTSFAATPLIELGMRSELGARSVLRSFVSVGVTVPSNDSWQQSARLEAASAEAWSFTASLPMSGTSARLEAGVQLLSGTWIDLRRDL